MKVALVNPNWSFEGSIYFGCREPHLPIEYGYCRALLEKAGHEACIIDGQLWKLSDSEIRERVRKFGADLAVVTTAPSYLFWRCAPPELRVPQALVRTLRGCVHSIVAVGPHGSTTPRVAVRKLGVDAAILGECEEVLAKLCSTDPTRWNELSSVACRDGSEVRVQGRPHASNMAELPPLRWEPDLVRIHAHHHHRFDQQPAGPGAELEASRGCPFSCTFCAKENASSDESVGGRRHG
jgi:B12-binding domain/radical SAM domain protein of rhizo-twelve system